ncbi:unnamed protein product [Larinioides sclopetarius]|uniref:CRAL-TRIO domain-containing protein n=2 Tax=Larinioides sclopetarius TaxID=280406 RepID=A0AAV2A9K7_9ARAC
MQMDKSSSPFLPYGTTDINEPSVLPYQKEINESPETRVRFLELLRQELKNAKDLDPCLDDDFLLQFLRVSKFDTKKTFKRLQTYYQQYDVLLDAFEKCSIPLHKAQGFNHLFISPYRMKNNSVLVIFKNESVDYRKCTFGERFYLELLFQHNLLIETPLNQICGATWVFDFDGFDIHALLAWTPGWLRTTINFSVNSAPLRYKAMHVVNAPPIFSYTYNMVKPLFPKKIRERLFLHSRNDGWQNLHASIPVDILPKQYGGNICDENLISCLENVEEMERKFLKSFAFGSIKNQHRRKSMKVIC